MARLRIEGYWLASGILGVTAAIMKRVVNNGADVVVTKSIGLRARQGHSGPVLASSHGGLINAVGLTNPGIDSFCEEVESLVRQGIPVVVSIFGSTTDEIRMVAEKALEPRPTALELNLSCPHAEIASIAQSPKLTYEYVKAVREVTDAYILAKLTANTSDITAVGLAAEDAGANAVVAINTIRAMKIDIHQKRPVLGNLVGGLSGPSIFPVAVRCVYDLSKALSIPIVGVGGVSDWRDAVEMHLAGATAIQIGTAVLEGLDIFQRIKEGVRKYLKDNNLTDVKQIIGQIKEG